MLPGDLISLYSPTPKLGTSGRLRHCRDPSRGKAIRRWGGCTRLDLSSIRDSDSSRDAANPQHEPQSAVGEQSQT